MSDGYWTEVKISKSRYDPNAHFKTRKIISTIIRIILSIPVLPFDLLHLFGEVLVVVTDWLVRDRASNFSYRLSNWERGFPLFGSAWDD